MLYLIGGSRLISALLAEQNEEWANRRYFEMDEFLKWADDHRKEENRTR